MKSTFTIAFCLLLSGLFAQNGAGVVINEFLASSDSLSGIPDPNGDFPDWIELYNNNTELIDLSGFYLSDDYVNFDKFQFPSGAMIDADGYVIIWADKDLQEAGLHADFKLNQAGEEIILLNSSFEVLDSVSFGPQETNVSLARIPNGTGDFTQRAPTFSANNDNTTAVIGIPPSQIKIYPNPTSGAFQVEWPAELPKTPDHWKLLDMQGRQMVCQVSSIGDRQFIIDPVGLNTGMYLLWIQLDNLYYVKRINVLR